MTQNVRLNSDAILQADATVDDSDKSFTVPADAEWDLQHVHIEFTSTATAGNRRMAVEIQDGSANVLALVQADAVQAATLTRSYNFGQGITDQSAFVNTSLNTAFPALRLAPGEVIRVYDIAAIDAAADDMVVRLMVNSNRI